MYIIKTINCLPAELCSMNTYRKTKLSKNKKLSQFKKVIINSRVDKEIFTITRWPITGIKPVTFCSIAEHLYLLTFMLRCYCT